MIDGGLNQLFQANIPQAHWQRIETGGTGRGIPDLNACFAGVEIWLETKQTKHHTVLIQPEQVGWAERRTRAGGRVFLAVRQAGDILWLLGPDWFRYLRSGDRLGSRKVGVLYKSANGGGPTTWNWPHIQRLIFG